MGGPRMYMPGFGFKIPLPMPTPTRSSANSTAAFAKAQRVMPGGVSSPVRAFKGVGGTPVFIKEADGCILTDVDGNKYVDYIGSYGPMIVGHANERVVAALSKAIGRGTSFGAPTEAETTLAEKVISAFSTLDRIDFSSIYHKTDYLDSSNFRNRSRDLL